jgi:hypothetical protein
MAFSSPLGYRASPSRCGCRTTRINYEIDFIAITFRVAREFFRVRAKSAGAGFMRVNAGHRTDRSRPTGVANDTA